MRLREVVSEKCQLRCPFPHQVLRPDPRPCSGLSVKVDSTPALVKHRPYESWPCRCSDVGDVVHVDLHTLLVVLPVLRKYCDCALVLSFAHGMSPHVIKLKRERRGPWRLSHPTICTGKVHRVPSVRPRSTPRRQALLIRRRCSTHRAR